MKEATTEFTKAGTAVIRDDYRCLIGGKLVGASSGATVATHNPATGGKLADVPDCGPADVNRAVEAAHAACHGWRRLPPVERAAYIRKFAARLRERTETYAWID